MAGSARLTQAEQAEEKVSGSQESLSLNLALVRGFTQEGSSQMLMTLYSLLPEEARKEATRMNQRMTISWTKNGRIGKNHRVARGLM